MDGSSQTLSSGIRVRLKRATRTLHSEQMLIYDIDNLNEEEEPVQIGQLDVHYVDDQVVGTLLIAQEYADGKRQLLGVNMGQAALDNMISEVLAEVSEPVGVPGTYAFEVYYASFSNHGFFSNYDGDAIVQEEQEALPAEDEYDYDMEGEEVVEEPAASEEQLEHSGPGLFEPRKDDDFGRRLRER